MVPIRKCREYFFYAENAYRIKTGEDSNGNPLYKSINLDHIDEGEITFDSQPSCYNNAIYMTGDPETACEDLCKGFGAYRIKVEDEWIYVMRAAFTDYQDVYLPDDCVVAYN